MPVPVDIAAWLACAAFVAMLFVQLAKARQIFLGGKPTSEITPQPLVVKAADQVVTKEQCDQLHRGQTDHVLRVENAVSVLRERMERDKSEAAFTRKNIYTEIKSTNEATRAHIEEVRKELTRAIDDVSNRLSVKIEALPDRVFANLKNLGALDK